MKAVAPLMFISTLVAAGDCIAINGQWIRAADLQGAVPELRAVAPETPLWRAPALGAVRQIRRSDWEALSRQWSIPLAPREVCVVQRVRPVDIPEWAVVLARAVSGLDVAAKPEITAVSHTQLPDGQIDLPLEGLTRMSGSSYLWRGRLRHAAGYEVPVWVKFRCPVWRQTLVAMRDLKTGESFSAKDVATETRAGWLQQTKSPQPSQVEGRVARRPIRAGSEVAASDLVGPLLVQQGQPAQVSVLGNGTLLEFPAIATQAGRLGDRILMENPVNRRRFPAVVSGPQTVSVSARPRGNP